MAKHSSRNHQPLHAITMLLNDLVKSPTSPYAPHARRVVDVLFALNESREQRLRSGGRQVWQTLRRLRAKAWRAADIDPEIGFTYEQAVQIANTDFEASGPDPATEFEPVIEGSSAFAEPQRDIWHMSGQNLHDPNVFSPTGFDWDNLFNDEQRDSTWGQAFR